MKIEVAINCELEIPHQIYNDAVEKFVNHIKEFVSTELSKDANLTALLLPKNASRNLRVGLLHPDFLADCTDISTYKRLEALRGESKLPFYYQSQRRKKKTHKKASYLPLTDHIPS
jgi:hypothetical protein